jgi:hypothetical protein
MQNPAAFCTALSGLILNVPDAPGLRCAPPWASLRRAFGAFYCVISNFGIGVRDDACGIRSVHFAESRHSSFGREGAKDLLIRKLI